MKEDLITFETAKLAKEKGFDWEVYACYYKHGNSKIDFELVISHEDGLCNENSEGVCYISAPTQSLLQKWLRENYRIQIFISFGSFDSKDKFGWYHGEVFYLNRNPRSIKINWEGKEGFKQAMPLENLTYEEALEKALFEALKLIP